MNNHMGSRATAEPIIMRRVLREIGRHRMLFLDSRTTPRSRAFDLARSAGLPAARRDVFLDNIKTDTAIRAGLRELAELSERRGYAVGIGHPHAETAAAIRRFAADPNRVVDLVSASRLVAHRGLPDAPRSPSAE